MYTEIVIKSGIKKDISKQEFDVLCFLFNGGKKPNVLPEHPFFELERWYHIGRSASFYHHPRALNDFFYEGFGNGDYEYLFSRSDMKNYHGEIEAFFDWFQNVSFEEKGMCIGWSWYEERDKPTLIFKT